MSDKPKIEDGGPAFPDYSPATDEYHKGISTRDYFAAKAMQAMSSCNWALDKTHHEEVAKTAYLLADVMLKERAKL